MQRELVIRAQHGDTDAFSVLAAGAIDRLHGIAYRILRDPDRADDATQRALISAWDHVRDLRDPERFDAWTYRLVVRAAYKEVHCGREHRSDVRPIEPSDLVAGGPSDMIADRDQIERAFRELTPEHRAVLALRYYADLPFAEIAEILEIPVGTVSSRLHHALRRMRDALSSAPPSVQTMEHALS